MSSIEIIRRIEEKEAKQAAEKSFYSWAARSAIKRILEAQEAQRKC